MSDFSIQQMNQVDAPGTKIVVVNGEMTIQNAGEIRNVLLGAFSDGEGLCLEMGKVTEIDLAGLQLLCAAHKTSMTDKKPFSVSGIDCEAIKTVIRDAGFLRHIGCAQDINKTCIWTGGEKQWQK
jgi:anti-anti-sigma regulatory factor